MPLESTMPSPPNTAEPTPPTSYLHGVFDDLDSLGIQSRRTTLLQSSEWPLELQSKRGSSGTTPHQHLDSEKDSLGAAIDRIGASGETGGEFDNDNFGGSGAFTPDLIGSSLGSSLGSLGVASLSLGGGTPESPPLVGTIPSAKVVQLDEWDSRSSYSKKNKSSDNSKSDAPSHRYREETIMPASPHGRKDKPHFHRRSSINSTVLPPTNSMEIIGTLEGEGGSMDNLPNSRKPPVPTPTNIQPVPTNNNNNISNPLSTGSGRGQQVTPLEARNFSPEVVDPQTQPVLCTTPPTGVFPVGSVRWSVVSRASGGAQLANDYDNVMPLDLSLLRDSYATMGLGSFNLLSVTEGSASPTIRTVGGSKGAMRAASFTLGDASDLSPIFTPSVGGVMREGSFTLDTSSRRQSTGILSSTSRSGYRRYGGTVASVSALEKHIPVGEASGLDFSLNSGPQRRARSAESSRGGSFSLSESTPVQRRVSPPSTSSEHRALFEELIRLRSEQEGSGSDWAAAQLNVFHQHAHPLGDGGDHVVTSPSPHPPSSHRGSGTVHVVPYPPPPTQPGDIVRTTRRRYKPDVVPVSLEPLCKAMETGEVERPERVWYVHPEWSEGVGDGGGAQRVIQYPITTPPLTPQQNAIPQPENTTSSRKCREWSLDEGATYAIAKARDAVHKKSGEDPVESPHPPLPTNVTNGCDAPSPVEYCIFQGKKIPVRERDRRIREEMERKQRLRDAAAAYLNTEKPNRRGLERLANAPVLAQPRQEAPLRPTFLPLPEQRPRGLSPLQQRPRPSSCN